MTVFTLGPEASYSHTITKKIFFQNKIELCNTISDVFEQVNKNKNFLGVVPIENMIEGTVRETFDLLLESNLQIYDILQLNIEHCLAAKNKNFDTIISHEQAIAQCRKFLQKKYSKNKYEYTKSSSQAAEIASKDPRFAAVTSKNAASHYGLQILHENIADVPNNKTKFAVISHKSNPKTNLHTYAALIPNNLDQPGLLIKMLFPFQENLVNLNKIESRPNKQNFNQHIFYIEFEGDARQARARKIFTYLEKDLQICKVKILGGQSTQTEKL